LIPSVVVDTDVFPIQTADGWVAATSLLHNIPLVTHNPKHFVGVDGLTVISEVIV
jgi:predicted nucleic acid-binding protein